jgi:hypothetical protein
LAAKFTAATVVAAGEHPEGRHACAKHVFPFLFAVIAISVCRLGDRKAESS